MPFLACLTIRGSYLRQYIGSIWVLIMEFSDAMQEIKPFLNASSLFKLEYVTRGYFKFTLLCLQGLPVQNI